MLPDPVLVAQVQAMRHGAALPEAPLLRIAFAGGGVALLVLLGAAVRGMLDRWQRDAHDAERACDADTYDGSPRVGERR